MTAVVAPHDAWVAFMEAPRLRDPLPPVPSGGWKWDDLTNAEQSLLRPPAWMRPCHHDHGRA